MIKQVKNGFKIVDGEKSVGMYKSERTARKHMAIMEYNKYKKVLSIGQEERDYHE